MKRKITISVWLILFVAGLNFLTCQIVYKAKWLEHNSYYALRTSDRFAWTWVEDIDWWTGKNLPEGYIDTLRSAKKKVSEGQPLGFEIDQMMKNAQNKAEEFYKNK